MGNSRARDPNAKRPHESHFDYRARLIRQKQEERDKSEPIVPKEAQAHHTYVEEIVLDPTGETQGGARVPVNQDKSSLRLMNERGALTDEQYDSALRIAGVVEVIQRAASVRCASLEARVDCSGSANDRLVESLRVAQLNVAYTQWRQRLPMPRSLFVDMVTTDRTLFATARKYGMGWPKARRLLRNALDLWPDIYRDAVRSVKQEDMDRVLARLDA